MNIYRRLWFSLGVILSSYGGYKIMIVLYNALFRGRVQGTRDGHIEENENMKMNKTERLERVVDRCVLCIMR